CCHPVTVHPTGRRPHVPPRRRCAQCGWRGRQQEGVRPAHLGQGRGGGHGRAGGGSLPAPAVGRSAPYLAAAVATGPLPPEPVRPRPGGAAPPQGQGRRLRFAPALPASYLSFLAVTSTRTRARQSG